MDKKEVARILHEVAVLLELQGENPFKVRAYLNAARTVDMLEDDLNELVKTGKVRQVKGIGSTLAEHISEMVFAGDLPFYHELRSAIPAGLLEMLRIPGLGPKKIYSLYKTLGLSGIAELEYSCHENRLLELKGFGKKTQDSILQGIEYIKRFQGQFLFGDVIAQARLLLEQLKDFPEIIDIQIAGSLRRCKEIVKDIDIVASSLLAKKVMPFFSRLPQVAEIKASGETKTSVVLNTGINADLRVVSPDAFAYALYHFTGSKEHNIAIRRRAETLGLKINEYGLFEDEEMINAEDEARIFRLLGLDYICPELREGFGEIEAAQKGELPDLVKAADIQGAFHVHTNYSDGIHTPAQMAEEAKKAGFSYLGISDHSQTAAYAGGLKVDDVKRQHEEIKAFNAANKDFHIFHGIESDIHPDGNLDYPKEILALFDFVIASVHSGFTITGEQATARLTKAMENPFVTMLGHPTGRLLLGREGYLPDMEKVIRAAKANDVIVELNANPMRLDIDWRHLKYTADQGVKISINPDAHRKETLSDTFIGVGIARKGWMEKKDVFNAWPLDHVTKYLADKKISR